jgi:hypothetical protein
VSSRAISASVSAAISPGMSLKNPADFSGADDERMAVISSEPVLCGAWGRMPSK